MTPTIDIGVLETADAVGAAIEPTRARVLAALGEPGSATSVAQALGLPRQRVNHHLRALERSGLVRPVGERRRRGLVERLVVATARSYVVSPDALGDAGADPDRTDRLSTRYLIALAARMVREVGLLAGGAERAGKPLATLAIDTEVRFATPAARTAFTADLANAVAAIVARHHDEATPGGRRHRLIVAAHPLPAPTPREEARR